MLLFGVAKVTRENLRAYLQRDWASARAAKTAYVRDRIVTGGASQAARYMDTLRAAPSLRTHSYEINQAAYQSNAANENTDEGQDLSSGQSQTFDQAQAAGQTLAEKIRRIDRRCLERLIALHRSRF